MKINENNSLKEIENGLRKIISFSMELKYGKKWIDNLKIGKEKIEEWKSKKEEERKRLLFQITEYRANCDNEDNYFPKITNVLVNGYDITDISQSLELHTKKYHVGDKINVAVKTISPIDCKICNIY